MVFVGVLLSRDGVPIDALRGVGVWRMALAFGIILGAVLAAAWSWSILMDLRFGGPGRRYLLALPAKHIPGGLGLPLSQLGHESDANTPPATVMIRLAQHFMVSVGSGGAASLVLLGTAGQLDGVSTSIGLVLSVAMFGAHPRPVRAILRIVRRSADEPAALSAVLRSAAVTISALGLMGLGFAVIVDGLGGVAAESHVAGAFVLSWAVGYAVIPVPAGIGLREGTLVWLLGSVSAGLLVLASLVFRFAAIVVDVLLAAVASLWTARTSLRSERRRVG